MDDRDDADSTVQSILEDADCDGTLTLEDCDDTDPNLIIAEDADCDGGMTEDDCNDQDIESTIV